MSVKKNLNQFENVHGQSKIKELQKNLEVEKAKVEALVSTKENQNIKVDTKDEFCFGLIGCTHFGSLYCNQKAMESFYEYLSKNDVNVVYHGGDVLDGHKVYRGQEFELRDVGLDRQIERLKNFKSFGVCTRFITGNHDQSFKNLSGVAVGSVISNARSDFEFLGEEQARILFSSPKGRYELMLIHPGGGSSYALSYRVQKIVESLEGGTKPNMLGVAHYHKAEFMPSYRNVATIQTGTFQNQTPFMARQGLAAHVGGWVVSVSVGRNFNTVKAEFVSFYDLNS